MKIKPVNVGPSATSNESINLHHGNRGTSHSLPPVPKVDPVVQTPRKQHTFDDGTVGAPSFDRLDYDSTDPAQANRSWQDTVAQINPHGAPGNRKLAITHLDLPKEPVTTVRFENGKKIVEHADAPAMPHQNNISKPAPSPSGPRRKVVGVTQPKNPNASLKPAQMSSVSADE